VARDVETEAERERVEAKEALAAVHASKMGELRERLAAAKRAKARPLPRRAPTPPPSFPLLTASRVRNGANGQASSPPSCAI
jgi:hypothetical protein